MASELEIRVQRILQDCQRRSGLEWAKELFLACLGFDRVNAPLPIPDRLRPLASEDSLILASKDEFKVLYVRLHADTLRLTDEKRLASAMLQSYPYSLFVFSNKDQNIWHLVNPKPLSGSKGLQRVYRRISIGPHERLRTAVERLSLLNVDSSGLSALDVQAKCDQVFDVERVTEDFYRGYVAVFSSLQNLLLAQSGDPAGKDTAAWAHDYALQLLNRIMFLYFVERKLWIGRDPAFVKSFWMAYKNSGQPKDTFFPEWLQVLFFEAFNKKFDARKPEFQQRFTPHILSALSEVPYLNGGLFTPNGLDKYAEPRIPDSFFAMIFDEFQGETPGFFERYNFTTAEDTPIDQEVAVDPEMIGKVYESLVNTTSEGGPEGGLRGEAGIFYSPRVEIDLMCRLSLVDRLDKDLAQDNLPENESKRRRGLLYQLLFAYEPYDKEEADSLIAHANLWHQIHETLSRITIVDPACGSGSFLVGFLLVLDDLAQRANSALGILETPYERRKRIISRNLYGVDVMKWAVHVAELRLWLQLIVESEVEPGSIHSKPLLPNLSFNIRCGDSLLQEVGGVNLGAKYRSLARFPAPLTQRINALKEKKIQFALGQSDVTETALQAEEREIFSDVLAHRIGVLEEEIKSLLGTKKQASLLGRDVPDTQLDRRILARKRKAVADIQVAMNALSVGENPFVWDLAFPEVFSGERHGFDIVIGNPPYVRYQTLADPKDRYPKHIYRQKIQEACADCWPRFFSSRKVAGQSDLYIYFYFYALSILGDRGTLCFITSNSWLDVAYGKELQEFLLRHAHIELIIDNKVKRSFRANINTVIMLAGKPDERCHAGLQHEARFVQVKTPFEEILSPVVFLEIEDTRDFREFPEFRCIAVNQRVLLLEGTLSGGNKAAKFVGGKWGGRYFRAASVYWTVLRRAGDRLRPLTEFADVRRGIISGANDFFFVRPVERTQDGMVRILCDDGSEHCIEEVCIKNVVAVKARELTTPIVNLNALPYRLVQIDERVARKPGAGAYIQWGESKGFHMKAGTRTRRHWYTIVDHAKADLLIPIRHKRRPVIGLSTGVYSSDCFIEIRFHEASYTQAIAASIFSTFMMMINEIYGRANFGQGLLETQRYEVAMLPVLDPSKVETDKLSRLEAAFHSLANRPALMIYDEINLASRRELDDVFLEILGFDDPAERIRVRDELYDETCRMVWDRMAKSGTARESHMTYDEWLATGRPFGLDLEDGFDENE